MASFGIFSEADMNDDDARLSASSMQTLLDELASLEKAREGWEKKTKDHLAADRKREEDAGNTAYKEPHRGQGGTIKIAGTECYANGSETSGTVVVVGHDAFGFNVSNARANVDTLALIFDGAYVVMPDLFDGAAADPKDGDAAKFLAERGDYGDVKRKLIEILPALRAEKGAKRFAWLGVGWGGGCALRLAADPDARTLGLVAAAGIAATLGDDACSLCAKATVPVCLVAGGDCPDLRPLMKVLARPENPSRDAHCLRTFHDVPGGFAGAGANRSERRIASAVATALSTCVDFIVGAVSAGAGPD